MIDFSALKQVNENELIHTGDSLPPLPDGDYNFIITGLEEKDTSKGGKMLVFTFTKEGEDRILTDNLNHVNANPKAVQIAAGTFDSICKAIGKTREAVNGETDLINNKLTLKLTVVEETYNDKVTGEPRTIKKNKIKKYLPYSNASQPQAGPSSPAASGGKMPWQQG